MISKKNWTPASKTNVARTMVEAAKREGLPISIGLQTLANSQLHVELPVNLVTNRRVVQ